MISFPSSGVPFVEQGLGTDTVWFGSGRIGVGVADHGGIDKIIYYGRQDLGRSAFFAIDTRSAYTKLFKPYLLIEDKAYRLELNRTQLFPGGYRSTFSVPEEGVEVEHDLVLVTDAVHQTVRVIRNPKKKQLRLRIAWHEYTRATPQGRTWGPWKDNLAKNTWTSEIVDQGKGKKATTWFGIVAEKPMTTRLTHSRRRYFELGAFTSGSVTVSALFGYNKKTFIGRAETLRRIGSQESAAAMAGWEKDVEQAPRLEVGIPAVDSFFRLSPLLQESLMPDDLPGGMRASAGTYWVWGWDTLVFCDAYLAAGQAWFLKEALELYHRTAHPTEGVGHQFSVEMTLNIPQAPAAQGLYTYALYQYVAATGDREVLKKHYPLVLTILKLAQASRHSSGLFEGKALFPDEPQYAGHTGHDLSVFNNSIFYQAARALEHLAGWMDDAATAKIAREMWQGLKKSFGKFWDAKKGYWYDSLDSQSLAPRRVYPSHALLCFSPFANELLTGRTAEAARFIADHLVYANALRMYPLWSPAFNGDGNQFGQHYPVGGDLLFLKSCAAEGRQELLERWLDWMKQFWEQNTVPEGVTVEAENEGPLYPDAPGGKQPFSGKSWYIGILHVILGITFDAGGLTAGPGLDRSVKIDGLFHAGRRWNVITQGKGRFIRGIRVNGVDVAGTCKIPADVANAKTMNVEITRGPKSSTVIQLLSATGARLTKWQSRNNGFQARLESPGPVYVTFTARKKPAATWQGESLPVNYDEAAGQGSVFLASDAYGAITGDLSVG
jgi:hypothetical protein